MMNSRSGNLGFAAALIVCALVVSSGCRQSELGEVADAGAIVDIRTAFSSSNEGGAGGAAVESTGTGWATLKGRVVFNGPPPAMKRVAVTKDHAVCSINGKPPLEETVVVDPATKGLANVAIFIRKAPRVHESAASPETESVEFDQKQCIFLTHVFPLTLGQTMQIKNSDTVAHNTKISGKNIFNQMIPAGKMLDFTPQKEETVPVAVACSVHPWMRAYYLPRKNGYYAVSAPDGSFEIPNLPAGEALEFQVWHESAPGNSHPLVLNSSQTKELKWSKKGRFKIKLDENEVRELEFTVPAAAVGG
jgi:hypothetical protein